VKCSTIFAAGLSVLVGLAAVSAAQEIMPTPTPTPNPVPVNVTPPASRVSASTHDGNLPGNTVDGSLSTRWSGYGNGAWLELDLGATLRIFDIQVAVYKGDTRQNIFDLLVSTDRASWRPVFIGRSSGTTTALERHRFSLQDARYVRYVGHGHVTNAGVAGAFNSVTEVAVFSNQTTTIAAPTNLRATPIYDAGAIQLQWTAGGDATHQIFRSTTPGGPYTWIRAVQGTQHADWGLQDGVQYCYVVSAGANAGTQHSRYSNESCARASVLPTPPPPRPDPPTNLTAQHGAVGCDGFVSQPLRLSWTAGARSTSFNVYKNTGAGSYTRIANVTAPHYEHFTMTSGYWTVRGVNASGESDPSNEVFGTFAVPGCPVPPEITPPPSAATASTNDGNVAGNAVDNNPTTRWSGFGDGAWLELDLGRIARVTHFRVSVYRGNERRNRFEIQVRSDLASTWTTVWNGQTSGLTTGFETFDLAGDPQARYVRYLGHGNVSTTTGAIGGWNSVNEIELFGY